jgi:hypothetical protein
MLRARTSRNIDQNQDQLKELDGIAIIPHKAVQ